MDKVIFLGNGLNQVADGGAAWGKLLNKIAGTPKTQHETEIRRSKPFTLWYEEICSRSRRNDLKEFIADSLATSLKTDEVHERLMLIDCEHIITTNYDSVLENTSKGQWKSNSTAFETLHSLFRRKSFGNKHIWHIHGDLTSPQSIMLGHEQYSNYHHKIRNYLTTGVPTESKARAKQPYYSKFSRNAPIGHIYAESWVDIFLENDVHFIGFGLDYTENHLWNLISEKRRLKKISKNRIGKTTFHHCSKEPQSTVDEGRLSILEALGVKIEDHMENTYREAYLKCIEGLS